MHEKINRFLDTVCTHIKYKPVHPDIRDELAIHVNELKEEFIKETQNEETALDMAITAMGDCDEIGQQLNKRHKPQTEWMLIGLTIIIAGIGCIVMYTSSHFESAQAVNFERYLVSAVFGIAVMVGFFFFDYTRLKKLAWPLYLLSISLLMLLLIFGTEVNGANRFITIAGLGISTEFTTLLFIISFAGFIDRARGKGITAILKLGILASISILPIIMQPNLSQALTLLIGYAVLIVLAVIKNYFGGDRKWQLVLLGTVACLFSVALFSAFFSAPYRINRLTNFIARGQSDPNGAGYQQVMADKWLMASNLFGATTEKISGRGIDTAMPYVTTDYVLINVFATLGWIAGITLIVIIAVYIGRIFITTSKIKNSYGFYLSLAACTVLAVQFITGILVNFNLFPSASVTIPFVSYGGVGYIVSMAFIGVILSIWRRNNLIPASPKNSNDSVTSFIKFDDGKLIVNFK